MSLKKFASIFVLLLFVTVADLAQTNPKPDPLPTRVVAQVIKSSPAYAAILLRRTEATAELEDLLIEYKEEFPKIKQLRAELVFLKKETNRILSVSPAEASKLSEALGKLVLRKVELQLEFANLQNKYTDDRTEVKQAKRKVEIFEAAIQEIIP